MTEIKMQGPENNGGISFNGEHYAPNKRGEVTVPHAAVAVALSHGFTVVAEVAAEQVKPIPALPVVEAEAVAPVVSDKKEPEQSATLTLRPGQRKR